MVSPPTFTLSREQVRELDRRAIQGFGVPGIVLMENAGRSAAEWFMQLNPKKLPTVILCGPGNNGGDGFVVARHLDNHGWPVIVGFFGDRVPTQGDAAPNYDIAMKSELIAGSVGDFGSDPVSLGGFLELLISDSQMWIVDALFGTGLSRPLRAPYDRVVEFVNAHKHPVFAIDIPSGLDCDTGEPLGPTIRATHTGTFVAHKKGFLNPASRAWTGAVQVLDIGAPRKLVDEYRQSPV